MFLVANALGKSYRRGKRSYHINEVSRPQFIVLSTDAAAAAAAAGTCSRDVRSRHPDLSGDSENVAAEFAK
jgi:hypothetical protein